jgi:hypothetical protein
MFGHRPQQTRDMCLEISDIRVSAYTAQVDTLYNKKKFIIVSFSFQIHVTVSIFTLQIKNKPHEGFTNVRFFLSSARSEQLCM